MSSLKEIADRAGVSVRTVARVLNGGNKEVWPSAMERAQRIRNLAEQLNYRPNLAAKAVSTGKFGAVGMLFGLGSPAYLMGETTCEASRILAEHDILLSMGYLRDGELEDRDALPRIVRHWAVDGLLISVLHHYPQILKHLIAENSIPAVWLNQKLEDNCVYFDDFTGAKLATEHLLSLGHRRILFANWLLYGHYSEADRQAGYAHAMRAAGLAPMIYATSDDAVTGPENSDIRLSVARRMLASAERPTAIVAYSTAVAGPLHHAATELGLKVGSDLSIVTFDHLPRNNLGVSFSTVQLDVPKLTQSAVDMVLHRIAHGNRVMPPCALKPRLVAGATTGQP